MGIKGIDVSACQGKINWDAVKSAGYNFAMLKLGYGSDLKNQDDKLFAYNVKECERVGIDWGTYLYSYALDIEDAQSEAQHILRSLKGLTPTYPIVLDMEDADKYKSKNGMPSNEMLVNICETILSTIENAGYYAMLYASKSWLENQLCSSELDKYDKWVAQWSSECTYKGAYGMWQYTDKENVSGISSPVDGDVSYKDYPTIMKLKEVNGNKSISAMDYPSTSTDYSSIQKQSYINYIVVQGDTLSSIASKHDTTSSKLSEINNIKDPNKIYTNQLIKIPVSNSVSTITYTVVSGDTLSSIASKYNTTVDDIIKLNNIQDKNLIYAGQKLNI